jgi:hypothetical protein
MPWGEYVFSELSDGTPGGLPAWMADPARIPSFTRGAPMTSLDGKCQNSVPGGTGGAGIVIRPL